MTFEDYDESDIHGFSNAFFKDYTENTIQVISMILNEDGDLNLRRSQLIKLVNTVNYCILEG